MNLKQNIFILIFALAILASSCSSSESAGREYMPDMAHSIAYEANVYTDYYPNTWEDASINKGSGKSLLDLSSPREPVKGTIARGYAGGSAASDSDNGFAITPNGSVPYYYGDNDDERLRASAEIINNPYPITEAALADGKNLYNIFCATCHGVKADGNGYLVRDDGGVYPAQPANLIDEKFIAASNGQYYHALIYGKNVMGGYSDKISYEERWNVIHYIRSLQAKEKKLRYDNIINTLNTSAQPGGKVVITQVEEEEMHDDGHGHNDGHGGHGGAGHSEGSHDGHDGEKGYEGGHDDHKDDGHDH